MGAYYSYSGNIERSKQIFTGLITHYRQKGDPSNEAKTWIWLAYYSVSSVHKQERINYYQHAHALYLQDHQLEKAFGILPEIILSQIAVKQFTLAKNELQQALIQYKDLGDGKLQYIYYLLYYSEYVRGNYYRALSYCLQGIRNSKPDKTTTFSGDLYAGAAKCNYAVKRYKESLDWIGKAIVADKDIISLIYTYKCLLVNNLIVLNRLKEAHVVLNYLSKQSLELSEKIDYYEATALYYDKINENDPAIAYYSKISVLSQNLNFPEELRNRWRVICSNAIAGVYLKSNQPAKAKKYIDSTAFIFKNAKMRLDPQFSIDFYNNLYKYHLAVKDYRKATSDLQRRVKLEDSIFTVDKNKQLTELDIQYQTAQQGQSIKQFHTESIAQKTRLEKANLQRNITIGGILMMIVISALFYRNYKQKQTANNIITHKNELLQHLLNEKEWLLKEVHHRVKNNLHTVICLLESQARYLENDALKAIENSQHRIYAMSLIHQKLYQSDDVKTINMAEYIPELVQSLEDGFSTSDQIRFKLNIDPVNLDISQAIPIGLIVNEAATNSIKYAFPGERKGEISISLIHQRGKVQLVVADNGIGMTAVNQEDEQKSLGLRLMKGLSGDIDADISFEVDNGTRISITFELDTLNGPESFLKATETQGVYI